MKNLTPELIAKAKAAKSAEELLELAKANSVEITEEEAKIYFEQLNATGAVSDDELDVIAGGNEEDEQSCGEGAVKEGDRFKLIGGKKCECGSVLGVAQKQRLSNRVNLSSAPSPLFIVCASCKRVIFDTVDVPYIEKI